MHILMITLALAFADCGGELAGRFAARALRLNPELHLATDDLAQAYVRLKREAERETLDEQLRTHLEENFGQHFAVPQGEDGLRFYRNALWSLRAAIARRWLAQEAAPIAREYGLAPKLVIPILDSFFEPPGYLASLEGPNLRADDVERAFAARAWRDFPWAAAAAALAQTPAGFVSQNAALARALGPEVTRRLDRAQMEARTRLTRDGHACCQNHEARCKICPLNYYWHRDPRNGVKNL